MFPFHGIMFNLVLYVMNLLHDFKKTQNNISYHKAGLCKVWLNLKKNIMEELFNFYF